MTGLDLLAKDVKDGGVSRIVVIRPTVTAGEDLGAVPGDVGQKIDPYMEAIYQTIRKSNHPNSQRLLEGDSEDLEFVALQFLRGQTLDDAFIILDEAQNTTPEQMEMALGRLGPNSRMVICGDPDQKDFRKMDGLTDALALFGNDPLFGNVVLDVNDIQRAGIVKHVVLRYNRKRAEIAARAQEQAQRRTLRVA
jgi:phosphate starvation-inducible PhoH-like protein